MLAEDVFCIQYAAYFRQLLLWKACNNQYYQSLVLIVDCIKINYYQGILITVHNMKYSLCMRCHSRNMSKCLNLLNLKTEICVDTLKDCNITAGITKKIILPGFDSSLLTLRIQSNT